MFKYVKIIIMIKLMKMRLMMMMTIIIFLSNLAFCRGGFSWGFNIASTDVTVETEELVIHLNLLKLGKHK